MSGGKESSGARSTIFGRFIDSFRRPPTQPRSEQRPVEEDLGLKTLRTVYAQYTHTEDALDKERRLYTMLPLFLKNCTRLKGAELITRFPECLEFSEHVALLFVRRVTQIAQSHGSRASEALLSFLDFDMKEDTVHEAETGILMLKVLQVFSAGPTQLVDAMMTSDLSSILVRCIHLFLDLSPPTPPVRIRSHSGVSRSSPSCSAPTTTAAAAMMNFEDAEPDPTTRQGQRVLLQRLLTSTLTHLCRHSSAVDCLLRLNDLSLLFGAISSPCPPYNKIWRKAAADCLLSIFRHSLSSEVIHFVHTKGCIGFCIRNIQLSIDQPPLDLVEIFATIFCCLKDSSDISQILIEDFAAHGGHKFLFDYLLYLERKGDEDAREAVRNMVFLISGLVTAGFHPLEPTVSEVGPFQVEEFSIPTPAGPGSSVRNISIFLVLQDAFIQSKSSHLGKTLLDTILSIYRSDLVNYFILEPQRTLPTFLEIAPQKLHDVQKHIFLLLEHVMVDLNYVPIPELTSLGLLLQQKENRETVCLGFNFLLRLISHTTRYKDVFREGGIFQVLVRDLETYILDLREEEEEDDRHDPHKELVSPSLPLPQLEGDTEEYIFLLIECLRATIEGNIQNGQVFREFGGSRLTLELVTYRKPRRMALRLITQLILLPDGSVDFNSLLDQLNCSAQTAVGVKSEILRTVLRVFQLDSQKKAVFREVCGFHYLISTLASLIGSMAPRRCSPWIGVPRSAVLKLVQLVFVVLMSAMQDDPANKMFFETNIRFQSFTAPLLLLGCFSRDVTFFPPTETEEEEEVTTSPGFQSFQAEFKTWKQPGERLDEDSFVFSASEVFRFLRDMAVDNPMTQSSSLLQVSSRKGFFAGAQSRTPGHLVHPGAVLCMVDLLPSVHMKTQTSVEEEDEEVAEEEEAEEREVDEEENKEVHATRSHQESCEGSSEPQSILLDCNGKPVVTVQLTTVDQMVTKVDQTRTKRSRPASLERLVDTGNMVGSEHSSLYSYSREESVETELALAVDGSDSDGRRRRRRRMMEKTYCKMPLCEAKKWCLFLQERVVSEIYSMAMTERNQQALCQVNLPQRILQRCGAVLANEVHPLHQALERTFERLSYQSLTPSDFRNFLRLGNPLSCTINDIPVQHLETETSKLTVPDCSPDVQTSDKQQSDQGQPVKQDCVSGKTGLDGLRNGSDLIVRNGTGPEREKLAKDSKETIQPIDTTRRTKYGGSLSLARIQSLVSMTTPRASSMSNVLGSPMFIEIDHSIDGFGCLFLPSVFPQQIGLSQQLQGTLQSPGPLSVSTSGVGFGPERVFPPNNGLTFSCWFYIASATSDDDTPFNFLSISHNFLGTDNKIISIPCLRILANIASESLTVTLQPSDQEQKTREFMTDDTKTEKIDSVTFPCPQLKIHQTWHHVVVTMAKTIRQKSKVSMLMDGVQVGVQKMAYLKPVTPPDAAHVPFPTETVPYLINAHIGTHVSHRHVSDLLIRLGPIYLFDEPVNTQTAGAITKLGPSYFGSFQAPVLGDTSLSSLLSPGTYGDPLPPLVAEDRVVFGISASHPAVKTVAELSNTYSTVDTSTIARELLLSESDNATPVSVLQNTSFHLFGPARSLGAIMCGYSGLRAFQPQPLRNLLSSVGGTSVMLGLVAMATSVDALYASMKALVCIVGNNHLALKEMERTGGFQVLGMLLRGKSGLINGNILHLTFTLVGTVDSEHENSCIPNPIAFRDLLADLTVWSGTNEDIQRSLLSHFFDLITHTRSHSSNTRQMQDMKLVPLLLFRLHDDRLSRATIKSICNVINAILGSNATKEDVQRVGQLMVTTLSHRDKGDENDIDIHCISPSSSPTYTDPPSSLAETPPLIERKKKEEEEIDGEKTKEEEEDEGGGEVKKEEREEEKEEDIEARTERRRRDIILRNIMFDMLLSLLSSSHMEINPKFAVLLGDALGLDWVLLFLHRYTHSDTVTRALRLLVQLLSLERLQQRFHDGEIFGPWVRGFEALPHELTTLVETSVTQLNPLKPHAQFPLPGVAVLSALLPHHRNSSQVFLLLIALLLGKTGLGIPFSARFDMETLDNVFQIGDSTAMNQVRLCPDAAFVLLSMARVLLHQSTEKEKEKEEKGKKQGVVGLLIKFLERLYRTLQDFSHIATSPEFIEALAATLFPPNEVSLNAVRSGRGGREGEKDISNMIEFNDQEFVVLANKEAESFLAPPPHQIEKESRAALLRTTDVAVCSVIQLLRTIAVDGFSLSSPATRDQKPVCPVLETVLSASPGYVSPDLQNQYQTQILNSILDHLKVGNEDVTMIFHAATAQVFARAMVGVGVFCGRLVDRLWQGVYLDPSRRIYEFLLALVEQALKQPNILPLGDLYRALNRTILFQLSVVPSNEVDQKALMDTLCKYSVESYTIFDETNVDTEFLECMTFRLLQIMFGHHRTNAVGGGGGRRDEEYEEDGGRDRMTGYQPMSESIMKSGANRLWQKMLELKHDTLQDLLSIDLPVPSSASTNVVSVINTAATSAYPDLPPPTPPPSSLSPPVLPTANPKFLRLQGCECLMTHSLTKAWESYLLSERHSPGLDNISRSSRGSEKRTGLLWPSGGRRKERESHSHSTVEGIVKEYVDVLCPILVLAAVKFEDLMVLKHKRNMDYRLRFTVLEWSRIEWELTRERGLWGPSHPSPLDKWMLDTVEGPQRMRKRMCRNHLFYHEYQYNPNVPLSLKKLKHQKPTSAHSKLHFVLKSMFQRPTVLSGCSLGSRDNKPLPFSLPGNDSLLSMSIEYPSGINSSTPFTASGEGSSTLSPPAPSTKVDMFPKSSEDDPVSQAISKMIEPDDEVVAKFQSARLTGLDSKDGVLLLGTTHFYVIEGVTLLHGGGGLIDIESAPEGSYDSVLPTHLNLTSTNTGNIPIGCVKWPYSIVREIHKRRYLLQHCALEVFSSDGRNQFLIFHANQRDRLYHKLKSRCSNLAESGNDTVAGTNPDRDPEQTPGLLSALITGDKSLATRWANGEMSNFQYLMQLNTLAGRTYNDLMQYPIFPWVLADYQSETLDLTNPATFRIFSLPMGAQSSERLKRFIERYNLTREDPTGEGIPPYYYGTHYSSAMIVASYLIRMEPFTGHFIKLQGGHFDLPDRLFHSIPLAWMSASSSNMADVRELIPEFFYLPEFLSNSNHFNLGTKQSGEALGDIVLPPWAKGSPIEFIRIHREALESDYVSAHLHEWIDLIFGYKQTGKEALKSVNIFHHYFYEGAVDIEKIDDPVKKSAAISFIHNFGQMPKQLFKKPHPSRKVFSYTGSLTLTTPPVAMDTTRVFYKNLTQLMPSKEPVKEIRGEVHKITLIGERTLLALDRNKLPLPPLHSRYFIWGFPDRSARVASVEGDRVLSIFENLHQGRILCSTMAEDNMLLTAGDSTVVCVWTMKNVSSRERSPVQLQLKHTLHGHTDSVTCLATSTAYNIIVSGSKDQTCIIWDMNKMVFVRQLEKHSGPVTMAVINQSNGNVVSCTKSQICLWTVNGVLLASTAILITGSFSLLCCTISEMFDWDQENVIVTGSTDGVVRMWVVELVREGETVHSPAKKKDEPAESNLDSPELPRPATLVRKMQRILSDEGPSNEEEVGGGNEEKEEKVASKNGPSQGNEVLSENGMSSDSEGDYTTPRSSTSERGDSAHSRTRGGGGEEKDNPLYYRTDSEQSSPDTLPHNPHEHETTTKTLQEDDSTKKYPTHTLPHSTLSVVKTRERVRANSMREEKKEGLSNGGEEMTTGKQRSRSQPPVLSDDTMTQSSRDGSDEWVEVSTDPHGVSCSIPVKTQISATAESDGNTLATEPRHPSQPATSETSRPPNNYAEEVRRRDEELRERSGKWIRKLTMVHTLTMHTAMARKDNDSPAAVTSLCISKDHRRLYVGDARGRVYSWTVSDSQGGVMEHWLKDEAVDKCMKCSVEFTFTERKHHCRDCGKIFCNRCSSYESEIKRLRILKRVRVCEDCYRHLRPKQSPKF